MAMVMMGSDMGVCRSVRHWFLDYGVKEGVTRRRFSAQGSKDGRILSRQLLQTEALLDHSAPGGAHTAAQAGVLEQGSECFDPLAFRAGTQADVAQGKDLAI